MSANITDLTIMRMNTGQFDGEKEMNGNVFKALMSMEGSGSPAYNGRQEEDPQVVYTFANWTSIDAHLTGFHNPAVLKEVGPLVPYYDRETFMPMTYHVDFTLRQASTGAGGKAASLGDVLSRPVARVRIAKVDKERKEAFEKVLVDAAADGKLIAWGDAIAHEKYRTPAEDVVILLEGGESSEALRGSGVDLSEYSKSLHDAHLPKPEQYHRINGTSASL
ncbi:hypothetical protein CONPUDRAFT_84740 [Coniophora puteana RWD-64-598 SS2]|uniref:Uncharacterized protein n=1 Tax=Coniophora puteana (strain RWD-64-598) TaxID=741705 RepID=A0A5M3ME95_CONPW|nr:uncharacterized protein CONPUDRAFT_84740 [Coniophora puteana RWD-64-598 SS2]EIW76901.1 hypothetical protein CONPUDRAFT_84740 [Coniophora puteana RWD-64-598 SS2]